MKKRLFLLTTSMFISAGAFAQSNSNNSSIAQIGWKNTAETKLSGSGNKSIQNQKGSENDASILLLEDYGSNTIHQIQDGNRNKLIATGTKVIGSEIYQSQIGNDNFASSSQMGFGHVSNQTQDGNSDEAQINQEGYDNLAVQEQIGDKNYASSDQVGRINKSEQYQNGNENSAVISQHNEEYASYGSYSYQSQTGNNNVLNATLVTGRGGSGTTQKQIGSYNTGNIEQGEFNSASQLQIGDWNIADSFQGGATNTSYQEQKGSYNEANITQYSGREDGSSATQLQEGSYNFASSFQGNPKNVSYQEQVGKGHISTITQSGYNHSATIIQHQ